MTEKAPLKMVKPTSFLEKFKSKRPSNIAGVGTLLTPLKLMRIAEVGDFVRLHPDEDNYWKHLSSKKIKWQRLALASKPHDVFPFLHRALAQCRTHEGLPRNWIGTAAGAQKRQADHHYRRRRRRLAAASAGL